MLKLRHSNYYQQNNYFQPKVLLLAQPLLRTAKFDKGLKEVRGLACRDPEYRETRDIRYKGVTIKVFPGTRVRQIGDHRDR